MMRSNKENLIDHKAKTKQKRCAFAWIYCRVISTIMVKSFLCCLPLSTGGFVIGVSGILFTLAGFLSASYFFFIVLKMLNYCQNCSTEVIGGKIIKICSNVLMTLQILNFQYFPVYISFASCCLHFKASRFICWFVDQLK